MHVAAAGNIVAAMSDLDGFTNKLNAILQADLTHAGVGAAAASALLLPSRAPLLLLLLLAGVISARNAGAQGACSPACARHTCLISPRLLLPFPPAAALAAGPLEVAPNQMQQLGSVLAVDGGGLPSPDTDALLKQLKALQEQVALLDRIQNIRCVPARLLHPPPRGTCAAGMRDW